MTDFTDDLRLAVQRADVSRYRIAKDLGIDLSHLGKWLAGECGLSTERLAAIADYLGLEITVQETRRGRRR